MSVPKEIITKNAVQSTRDAFYAQYKRPELRSVLELEVIDRVVSDKDYINAQELNLVRTASSETLIGMLQEGNLNNILADLVNKEE